MEKQIRSVIIAKAVFNAYGRNEMNFVEFAEIAMLVLFGVSWPFNIAKSWRSRTAKGKSVLFEIIVICGYVIGVSGKFVEFQNTGTLAYAVWFYFADIAMVLIDVCLYVRNTRLDKANA